MRVAPRPDPVRFVDERLGAARAARFAVRYVFPDHWSFMIGELALYALVVLIGSGIYLALYFEPSSAATVYHGSYVPLQGASMSQAYASTVNLSFDVPAGLLIRQTHHWAALFFVAAIVVHLLRIFFTGAFRRPRELNWVIGLTLLVLAILEGFAGYSLPDDLLSGMGLAIAYGVALSLPLVGGQVGALVWGGEFPGAHTFEPRLYIVHVLLLPAALVGLVSAHLAMIVRQRHSQFPGPGRRELNVVGSPLWPGYALRSLSLLAFTTAILVLLGGLVQINPIWQWGPYEPWLGTNGAQPDWYLGWLIGALRIVPGFDVRFAGHTWIPNPFFGGVLFPGVVFAVMYLWPWIERRCITRDARRHDLLDRPRDDPRRTAIGSAFFAWVITVFSAGSADRVLVSIGIPYEAQVWFYRAAFLLVPVVVFAAARRIVAGLARGDEHPLRPPPVRRVRRAAHGGFETTADD